MYRRMGKSMQLPTECRNMYNNTGDMKSKLHSQSLRKGRLKKKTGTKLLVSLREGTVLKEAVSEPSLTVAEAVVT